MTSKFKLFENPDMIQGSNLPDDIETGYHKKMKPTTKKWWQFFKKQGMKEPIMLKNDLWWNEYENYAFFYFNNKIYVGSDTHHNIFNKVLKLEYGITSDEYENKSKISNTREALTLPGRLWLDKKLISFWFYPKNKEELYTLLYDIHKKLNKTFNPDGWFIEINNLQNNDDHWKNNSNVIPIDNYVGSKKRSTDEIEMQHIISPMKKTKTPKGWASKGIKYKMPGESEIEAKHRLKNMYQENMILKFKTFESEEILKGKFKKVDYKIIQTDWKENVLTLVTNFKIVKIEGNYIEVISKGYEYVELSNNKKGWIDYDDFESKKVRRFTKNSVKDGTKRIKTY